jgi:hypothetical protein
MLLLMHGSSLQRQKRQLKIPVIVKPCFVWIRTYPKRLDPESNLMVKLKSEVKGRIRNSLGKKLL